MKHTRRSIAACPRPRQCNHTAISGPTLAPSLFPLSDTTRRLDDEPVGLLRVFDRRHDTNDFDNRARLRLHLRKRFVVPLGLVRVTRQRPHDLRARDLQRRSAVSLDHRTDDSDGRVARGEPALFDNLPELRERHGVARSQADVGGRPRQRDVNGFDAVKPPDSHANCVGAGRSIHPEDRQIGTTQFGIRRRCQQQRHDHDPAQMFHSTFP